MHLLTSQEKYFLVEYILLRVRTESGKIGKLFGFRKKSVKFKES